MCQVTTTREIRVQIVPDTDAPDPTVEFDHLGTIVSWHRRYQIGPRHGWSSPADFLADTQGRAIILPLYLYDHTVLRLSTQPWTGRAPHAEWDSGQVGYIYVPLDRVRQEYGVRRVTRRIRDQVMAVLAAEVDTYSHYLNGDVYGYIVEAVDRCPCGRETVTVVDSCWGFYGWDPMTNGMAEAIAPDYVDALKAACDVA